MARQRNKRSAKKRHPTADAARQLLQREREQRKEALERERATSEILRVIAESQADVQPVFDTIVRSAVRLCGGKFSNAYRYDGEQMHLVATSSKSAELRKILADTFPMRPDQRHVSGRAILAKATVKIKDIFADPAYDHRFATTGSWRRVLSVPMLRGGEPIGVIVVVWAKPGPISKRQEQLLKTFADQAVIAIENVRLFNETKEALERQTAMADILRVISSSPTDLVPVFEAILASATGLCGARSAVLHLYEGDGRFRPVAVHGGRPEYREWMLRSVLRIGRPFFRVEGPWKPSQIDDVQQLPEPFASEPPWRANVELEGIRTLLNVPLVKDERYIGCLTVYRREMRRFTEREIALLQTFADQAVIAIENVRLFKELEARNGELTESLEQQTATGEILRVISSSPTDLAPVFDALAKSVSRFCDAPDVVIARAEGEVMRYGASVGPFGQTFGPDLAIPIRRGSVAGRAVLERTTIHVHDLAAEPDDEYPEGKTLQRRYGHRTIVAAPLLLGDTALGVITMLRQEVRPFNTKQLALLRTFADQAVIAIENARLFNETKEALEQQTATAEILKVISGSPTDTQPVFDAIAKSGVRLFQGVSVSVRLAKGNRNERVAFAAGPGSGVTDDSSGSSIPLKEELISSRSMLRREVVHVPDIMSEPWIGEESKSMAERMGYRAVAVAPMVRDRDVLGIIGVTRAQVGPFKERDLALLKTFADQAVIAIRNVELFNETKEALERQTATAEILKVIASSPSDVQPVFEAVAQRAAQLCNAANASVVIAEGTILRRVATFGHSMSLTGRPARTTWINGRAFLERRTVHVEDVAAVLDDYPEARENQQKLGFRTMVSVPMIREGRAIGTIGVWRREVKPFSKTEIELLETFAAQAVIAIENTRLFNETKEALDQQKASAEVLAVISSSIADTQPVFEKILESCERVFAGCNVGINIVGEDGKVHVGAYKGPGRAELEAFYPVPVDMESGTGAAILQRQVVHYPDCDGPGVPQYARRGAQIAGNKSVLLAPMLWEGEGVGAIFVGRPVIGRFSEKEIALLRTFADQAAIAIQNAKLFREIQEKSRQLEVASEHKSHFLASMSHELRTPLNAILGFNEMLLDQVYGELSEDVKAPLENMQASGKHLLRLINNVLDLAKIEAGRMELALTDYSVQDTVESVRSTLRPLAESKGLDLLATVPQDLPLAYGDAGRITQCLMNLAGNSLKFTKEGRVEISVQQQNGQLRYRVADTGIGIPPDKIGSLFTEFKQTDATIASEYGGTGLGLSITKKFIEMHGGRIWVESEPGTGSTFTFEVPLRAGERKAA